MIQALFKDQREIYLANATLGCGVDVRFLAPQPFDAGRANAAAFGISPGLRQRSTTRLEVHLVERQPQPFGQLPDIVICPKMHEE